MPVPKIKKRVLWAERNGDLVWLGAEFLAFVGFVAGVATGSILLVGSFLVAGFFIGRTHLRFLRRQKLSEEGAYSGLLAVLWSGSAN